MKHDVLRKSNSPMSDFAPAAAMVYTSLASIENGTSLPTDYGTGVEYADGILNSIFPGQKVGLQVSFYCFYHQKIMNQTMLKETCIDIKTKPIFH